MRRLRLPHLPAAVLRSASAFLVVLALLFVTGPATRAQAQDPETRSAWITQDRFATPAEAEATIRRLADAGFNLALVRAWYGGATIYPSAVVERAGGPRQHSQFAGRDPLADLILLGRRYGVRIGTWMEYGLAERITSSSMAPGPILAAHPEWRMVGRTGLDYVAHATGTRSWWMDPAHPEVRAFVRDLFAEQAARYPDLAVVEYDRFRYPDPSFSYSPVSIAAYRAATGEGDPLEKTDTYAPWVAWRRSVITRMAGEVYRAVKAANPRVTISAAVVPPYMLDGSDNKMQHWPTWADSGYVDALDPMFYGSASSYETWVNFGVGAVKGQVPIYPGAQVSGNNVVDLVAVARRQRAAGITFWYESDLTAADMTALRAGPFAQRVLPDFDDRRADDADPKTFFGGAWTVQTTGHKGTSRRIEASSSGIAVWRVPILHRGDYDLYMRWPGGEGLAPSARVGVSGPMTLAPPGETFSFTIQPRAGTGDWVRVGTVRTDSMQLMRPADVEVVLSASPDGAVVADGVRLVRVQPMRAEEVVVEDLRTLTVRTTYDAADVRPERFSIAGVTVASATVAPDNARIVRLTLDRDLTAGTAYTLSADLVSVEGYLGVPGETIPFTATPAASLVIDDGETGFLTTGTWTTVATGGHGDDYRTASLGASAIWNTRVGEAGRYAVEVYVPAAAASAGATQSYQIGIPGGALNASVSTGAPGWQTLATVAYDANASVLVRLTGASTGTLVADAVRWRRTVGLTTGADVPDAAAADDLRVYPNPVRDVLRLDLTADPAARVTVEVVDALGRRVVVEMPSVGVDAAIPVSHLAPGVYVVVVRIDGAGAAPRVLRRAFVRRP